MRNHEIFYTKIVRNHEIINVKIMRNREIINIKIMRNHEIINIKNMRNQETGNIKIMRKHWCQLNTNKRSSWLPWLPWSERFLCSALFILTIIKKFHISCLPWQWSRNFLFLVYLDKGQEVSNTLPCLPWQWPRIFQNSLLFTLTRAKKSPTLSLVLSWQ